MDSGNFRVAVIGSGVSGLAAIKCCLDEGLQPVCFERSDRLGGLWRYRDDPVDGQGCVMKSTVINTSKEMMAFSDFPIPAHYPNFMHNTQIIEFFEMYAKQFDLERHIRYETDVLSVRKGDDFAADGKWRISSRDKATGDVRDEIFEAVLVCTGHHADKYIPKFNGLENFKGKVLHSHDYRRPKGYEDKRVLVVGIGNSGGDVATELSRVSSKVYLSTRRGTWILNRVSDRGLPMDMLNNKRIKFMFKDYFQSCFNAVTKWKINSRVDHALYRLKPLCEPHQQQPMVNDDMPNRIICGALQVRGDVREFTTNGVTFDDGSKAEVDTVVLATGYSFGFPFLDKKVIDVQENVVSLYMNTFLPDLEHPTMAIIGCVQGFGAITPEVEMQCRAATRVFKGLCKLPPKATMWATVSQQHKLNELRYAKSRRHTLQVDSREFMDGLAELCGCSVDFWSLLRQDPRLAWEVFAGPFTPYQFRLFGPGAWPGARDAILNQWERVYTPFRTRNLNVAPITRTRLTDLPAAMMAWIVLLSIFIIYILF